MYIYYTIELMWNCKCLRVTESCIRVFQVWFKNRRARRKRQSCGSKVKLPSPPHSLAHQSQIFNAVL